MRAAARLGDRLAPRPQLVRARVPAEPEVAGLGVGFHQWKVGVVEGGAMGQRARLGHVARGLAPDDLLEHPDGGNQPVEIDAGRYPHLLEHVHDVLGGRHAGRPAVATVGAATNAARCRLDLQLAVGVKDAQGGVDARQSHAAAVVQVQVERADVGPALADRLELLLDDVRHAPAHRVAQHHPRDRDPGTIPQRVLAAQQPHPLLDAEATLEVRAPGGIDRDSRLACLARERRLDDARPAFDLLLLAEVGVASRECACSQRWQKSAGGPDGAATAAGVNAASAARDPHCCR